MSVSTAQTFDPLDGGFANPPTQSAQAFRAVMQAMARPGRIEHLVGARPPAPLSEAAATLLLVVLDPTTPVFLAPSHDTPAVRQWIAFHTGAPLTVAGNAGFAVGDWASLQPIAQFQIGTPEYPDRSATLVIEVETLEASGTRLSGPGIETQAHLNLPEPEIFKANHRLYPLGIDCFFTCRDQIAGLPRSTSVEIA